TVAGDTFAAEFVASEFRAGDIRYVPVVLGPEETRQDRSTLYLELLPLLNSGRVRLLDHSQLLRELRGLERKRGATRDRDDHRPGGHEGVAIAATIALVTAAGAAAYGSILETIAPALQSRGALAGLWNATGGTSTADLGRVEVGTLGRDCYGRD